MKKLSGFLALSLGITMAASGQSKQVDISMYPQPEKGYRQVIIDVPHSKNDNHKKIEFRVGKYMEVDGCNHYGLMGTLEKKELQGWGYSYYTFKTQGQAFSTQMGCPDASKRNLFVTAQPETVNYNGRLPVVIYVPDDYEVKFQIYTTDGDDYEAGVVPRKK